jgi:hypothetical protein
MRAEVASLWLKMQAITKEAETLLQKLEWTPTSADEELIDRVCRGVASTQEGQQLRELITAMRQDAARYEFLREKWGLLVVHTEHNGPSRQRLVSRVELCDGLNRIDPQSLGQAIDAAIVREQEQDAQKHLVLGQCPKCWAINRHEESCPDRFGGGS